GERPMVQTDLFHDGDAMIDWRRLRGATELCRDCFAIAPLLSRAWRGIARARRVLCGGWGDDSVQLGEPHATVDCCHRICDWVFERSDAAEDRGWRRDQD